MRYSVAETSVISSGKMESRTSRSSACSALPIGRNCRHFLGGAGVVVVVKHIHIPGFNARTLEKL